MLVCLFMNDLAFAESHEEAVDMTKVGPLARPVTEPDEKGIEALWKASDEAFKNQDMEAAAALHDWPVYMGTDNSAGVYMGSEWSREQWLQIMSGFQMPEDFRVKHDITPHFLSNTMAIVIDEGTMMMGGKKLGTFKNASLVIKKDGKWLFKSGLEAGWGDVPPPEQAAAP